MDGEPIEAVHVIPSFLRGDTHSLDSGLPKLGRVAKSVRHFETARAMDLIRGDVACFRGPIDRAAREGLLALRSLPAVAILVINSGGGSVNSAIDIATVIEDRQITLVIDEWCFSSCASK